MANVIQGQVNSFLRRNAKLRCPFGDCGQDVQNIDNTIREHLKTSHESLVKERGISTVMMEFRGVRGSHEEKNSAPGSSPHSGSMIPEVETESPVKGDASPLNPNKRIKSPGSSVKPRGRSSSPQQRRLKNRTGTRGDDPDFKRSTTAGGALWSPQQGGSSSRSSRPRATESSFANPEGSFKQPETRPISQDQLVAEVKGIYAGLVMVESKCIEVDNAQSSQNDTKLNNEQWQALIALHRTLLHEHHDFFLASQHPSASQALKKLATKYAMPARMWRHGIHSFLELLRHRLPASLEHMLTFIYLAYSMMALLYETVPAFEDTWIECLGDLSRYRMAIEEDDIRDREIWTSVSRHWYSKASDKAPTTGRLYHHLAILARPNALQQLFYYTKSLCVPVPFTSARESILTLFEPLLKRPSQAPKLASIDAEYVKCHGILFCNDTKGDFDSSVTRFFNALDNHISRIGRRWMEAGYHTAISNCCGIMGYGKEENLLVKTFQQSAEESADQPQTGDSLNHDLTDALRLANGTACVVLRRVGDDSIFPFLHVSLVFLHYASQYSNVMNIVAREFPWSLVRDLLNSILLSFQGHERLQSREFPLPPGRSTPRPLPEDFAMRGLVFTDNYFPGDFFSDEKIDDDEKYFEVASMTDERRERILWIASRLAEDGKWLAVNPAHTTFSLGSQSEGLSKTFTNAKPIDTVMVDIDEQQIIR